MKVDDIVPTYEFTGGGPIAKDHLWFFGAGRLVDLVLSRQTTTTNIPYAFTRQGAPLRGQAHLLGQPEPHRARRVSLPEPRSGEPELVQRDGPREPVQPLAAGEPDVVQLHGRALAATSSSRARCRAAAQKFVGSGATSTDIIDGTLVTDQARGTRFWAPTFCAVCGPDEERNNENLVVKGTYFLSTRSTGSHNLVFGYDTFNDIRIAENHQSGSDYRILGTTSIIRNGVVYPSWTPSTVIQWNPIDAASQGTDFRTHSLFFNDQWRLSERVTINLGVRWDKNSGKDSADQVVADDSAFSPRLAVSWDPTGDARWTVNAGYGKYVAGLANGIADGGSSGGVPATYQYAYLGPTINTDAERGDAGSDRRGAGDAVELVQRQRRDGPAADVRRHPGRQPAHRRRPAIAEHARVHGRRDRGSSAAAAWCGSTRSTARGPTSTTRSATRRPAPWSIRRASSAT